MSVRIAVALLVSVAALTVAPAAWAKSTVQSECGAEYQAAKAAGTLDGKKWPEFLAACKTRRAAGGDPSTATTTAVPPPLVFPDPTKPTTTSTAPTTGAATTARTGAPADKPASGGRKAMLERQRACGAEWRAQKADLEKTTPGIKWPQYWSACNKRMKAAAG